MSKRLRLITVLGILAALTMQIGVGAQISGVSVSGGDLDRAFTAGYTLYHVTVPYGGDIPTVTATGATTVKTASSASSASPADTVTVLKDDETGTEYRFVMQEKDKTVSVTRFELSTSGKMTFEGKITDAKKANLLITKPKAEKSDEAFVISDINKTAMQDAVLSVISAGENDGVFKFEYQFPSDAVSGMYGFYIGADGVDGVNLFKREAYYATAGDTADVVAALNSFPVNAAAAVREQFLAENAKILKLDLTDYATLTNKSLVYSALFNTGVNDPALVGEGFTKAVGVTLISQAASASIQSVVSKYADALGLDLDGDFNDITDKTAVYNRLLSLNLLTAADPYKLVKSAFEGCVAVLLLNQAEPAGIPAILANNYAKFGITADNWAKFQSLTNQYAVHAAVTNKNFANEAAVLSAFNAVVNPGAADSGGSSNGSNSGGGRVSGGGASTSFSADTGVVVPMTVTPDAEKPVNEADVIFSDIDGVPWAETAIVTLYEDGIINGKDDGTYAPNDNITREEFVKLLILAMNERISEDSAEFEDVIAGEWYESYISTVVKIGVVNGMSETEFGIGQNITRQDMAVMISRAIAHKESVLDVRFDNIDFADKEEFAPYAQESIEKLAAFGLMRGVGENRFAPANFATRAEAAVVIYQFMKMV